MPSCLPRAVWWGGMATAARWWHRWSAEWIGVVAEADRATETSTTRAFVRFGARHRACVRPFAGRRAGWSIQLHCMRCDWFYFPATYIHLSGCCFNFTPSGALGWGWTGPGRAHERACSDRSRARRRNGVPTSLAACLPALQRTKRKCMRHRHLVIFFDTCELTRWARQPRRSFRRRSESPLPHPGGPDPQVILTT
jgi:hypothetical protein